MPAKQQVLDQARALDRSVTEAADRKLVGEVERVKREQVAARRQLVADCEASAGHVFLTGCAVCMFCAQPADAAQQLVARNLSTAA